MSEDTLQVLSLVKRYNGFTAVDQLSFEARKGEILGLLGPNGAGKTTTIRIIIGIFDADEGSVCVLGRLPHQVREQVGYLPEERGLYRDRKVLETLVFLAELKGVPTTRARRNALAWLERVELSDWANHFVRDLSRGMQQKLQFAASLVHDPDLVILDEPFQGLDPVNVELLNRLIRGLQAQGKTILLSAHEMSLVEALCDRIVLVNRGKAVLYGSLAEIKRMYAPHAVRLRTPVELDQLPGVTRIERCVDGAYLLNLGDGHPQDLLRVLVAHDIPVEAFEVATVPLQEIFVSVVKEGVRA